MVTADDRGFIKYWQINFNNVHTYQAHSEPIRSTRWGSVRCRGNNNDAVLLTLLFLLILFLLHVLVEETLIVFIIIVAMV